MRDARHILQIRKEMVASHNIPSIGANGINSPHSRIREVFFDTSTLVGVSWFRHGHES
jgi:hypothetical protein